MHCSRCHTEITEFERHCPACDLDLGYPNVRAAQKAGEQEALAQRYEKARVAAAARGCGGLLADFCQAVRASRAVLCRSLSKVKDLLSSDNELYATFYQLVGAGARRPEDTQLERERLLADNLLFPHYHDKVRFAALSLTGRGAMSYGECSLALKDLAIRHRATVFEENSLYFWKRRNLGSGAPVPAGCRATWDQRDQLAAAKLEPLLQPDMGQQDFAGLLLRTSGEWNEDFIEVHIYGPLHRQSVERLVLRQPKHRADQAILKEVQRLLRDPKVYTIVETYE